MKTINAEVTRRIRDRLDGMRYVFEQEASQAVAGVAYANALGKLAALEIIEHALKEFLDDERVGAGVI